MLDRFLEFELPADIEAEYGVRLTPEAKRKIVGGNIARLHGIDVEAKQRELAGDEFDVRHAEFLADGTRTRPGRSATRTGVAGTPSR